MFRNPQFVTSPCLQGTHRSLLRKVKDSQKSTLGRAVSSCPISGLLCSVGREKGLQGKQHEPWNISCFLQKPFSCLVNTSCFMKPFYPPHNVTHQKSGLKYATTGPTDYYLNTTSSQFIFSDNNPYKCLLFGRQSSRKSVKHRISQLNRSIISKRRYHTVSGATSYKDSFCTQYELSKKPSNPGNCGPIITQTCGLHKTILLQATLDECLSAENEARCRGQLQANTALYEKEKGNTWAAVLVSLCTVEGDPSFLFTLRSSKLRGRHKGDVSFAGGKRDPSDRNVVDTALRETREELGIAVTENEVWGVLKPLRDVSGMMIAPVLANLGPLEALAFHPNPTEVEEIFTLTVSHVCNPHNRGYTHFRTGDRYGYTLPVFHNAKYRIWGLTAVALDHTLKLIMLA